MLDRLILPDLAAKDDAFVGVGDCLLQRPQAYPDDLRRVENALGVQTVEKVGEASSFLADQAIGRDFDCRKRVDWNLPRAGPSSEFRGFQS